MLALKKVCFNCLFELMSLDQQPHSGKRLMRLLEVRRPGWNTLTAATTEDREHGCCVLTGGDFESSCDFSQADL